MKPSQNRRLNWAVSWPLSWMPCVYLLQKPTHRNHHDHSAANTHTTPIEITCVYPVTAVTSTLYKGTRQNASRVTESRRLGIIGKLVRSTKLLYVGRVSTGMGDYIGVQLPVQEIYLSLINHSGLSSAWPFLRGLVQCVLAKGR